MILNNFFFNFFFYKILKNTNIKAKNIYNKKKTNIAIYTIKQTLGRGRLNRKWISNEGDLTCSFLLKKKIEAENIGKVNLFIAYRILLLLKKKLPEINFKIKWPNDIYVDNKKIGGILIETTITKKEIDFFIIGIGINIKSSPKHLDYETVSLKDFGVVVEPISLFFEIARIFSCLSINSADKILNINNSFLMNFKDYGKNIKLKVRSEIIEGKFFSINEKGELQILKNENVLNISYGEVI
jgi:BirA family biotin operon repressor/biotin-[acetyl-CoA-carboxylase] ligase|tara:strand:+ start:1545 stop:2267 length:723 start_codon:yes stop_codon:yes gene_type:complete